MATDPNDQTIETNLGIAAEIAQGDTSGKQHPLPDQIAAAKYLKEQEVAANANRVGGLGFFNMVPPGHS